MDNFTEMLADGMAARGHQIDIWHPKAVLSNLPFGFFAKKWLGYFDQYFLFPADLKIRLLKKSEQTLFVFTDQALGPWVPIFKNRRHIIHCHDFLALQSASGLVPENKTSWTGKQYQAFIKRGFHVGKNFICVSNNTRNHLKEIVKATTIRNEVVHNGLSKCFRPINREMARRLILNETGILVNEGYILHVGGNQWYKNRLGVVEIYNSWRTWSPLALPLLLVGDTPSKELVKAVSRSRYKIDIHFIEGKDIEFIVKAYSGAAILLFPSLSEGFGWPIAEAMACGCPVITTNLAPMTEVGGDAAFYIEKRPIKENEIRFWANKSANLLHTVITASKQDQAQNIKNGFENIRRFNVNDTLDRIEQIYLSVIKH